jgi:hypothetical protein
LKIHHLHHKHKHHDSLLIVSIISSSLVAQGFSSFIQLMKMDRFIWRALESFIFLKADNDASSLWETSTTEATG